jgi:Protein of unknown function (DUF642)/PEP-CTERM motif
LLPQGDTFQIGTSSMRTTTAIFAATISALAVVSAAGAASAAELLINGGFEDIGAGAVPESWGGLTYYPDGTHVAPTGILLPGWTVQSGSVDLAWTTSAWGPAASGTFSMDLDGWTPGTISQSFNDVAGQTYTVSYDYSRNPANAAQDVSALVSAGGQSTIVDAPDGAFGSEFNMTWQPGGFTFVGTGDDTITLASLDPQNSNAGVFFDNVSVSGPAVPEPASWALMIGGFGMAGAMLRRRRAGLATA